MYKTYERSRFIENRFKTTLSLIDNNRLNAEQLAIKLDVSRPTVTRIITELKQRGYPIKSVYKHGSWSYQINRQTNGK